MSWEKKTIGELCHIEKGKIGIKKAIPGEFPLVVTAEERLSHNEFHFDGNAVVIPLVSSTGHGHASLKRIHFQSGKFAVGNILCAVIPNDEDVLRADFLYRFLDFNKEKELVGRMRGMANVSLPIKEIAKIEIPVPTIEEQIEFVQQYASLEIKSNKLGDELTHQLDLVQQLRQAFLREAMQGKLVPQDSNDEPATDLLKKIKLEKEELIKEKKIKKQKPKLPPTEIEIPFEIPKNWKWCRLGDICNTNGRIGWKGLTAAEYKKAGPLFLSVHSLNYGDYVDFSQAFHITQARYDESPEIKLRNDDILICKDGAGIGKLGIIKNLKEQATINSSLLLIRKYLNLDTKFIYYFLLSSHFQKIVNERIMGASTPHLYQRDIVEFLIALPPLKEQAKIVSKLEELLNYCETLESSIKESQQQNEMLLKQVLAESLGLKIQKLKPQKKISKSEQKISKFDPNTTLMDIVELLKKHGKLHAEELWKMSKYPNDIDAFYAELKEQIELNNTVKESGEKGYLELA